MKKNMESSLTGFSVSISQCFNCENAKGTYSCKEFGKKPEKYVRSILGISCPQKIKK